MGIRAIRGAVQLESDSREAMDREIPLLLAQILENNHLSTDDVISAIFTVTNDLSSEFPAAAARRGGWVDIPLMCAVEIDVPGALPRTVRVLLHVESARSKAEITHVYRGGASVLRPDLPS